ncbi:amidohydrolase [Actinomadura sp. ATCC 31491]|uniref:Amidohydrolase n=1 Tax=Actinomadura luzonensis TaxID=2805427 RepID=A0ABT0G209_9ACTN|nr:amidohydrolase family protein [Actinomadura luzonensis]MCK2218549.1 amidohydrolase [Actinomadura luzonensis]
MPYPVVDAHRLIGPIPFDDLPEDPRPDMARLGIGRAYVTHSLSLHSDARAGNEALLALDDPRLVPVPVLLPDPPGPRWSGAGPTGAGWSGAGPTGAGPFGCEAGRDVPMVRLCPARHRFDLTGPSALRALAALGVPAALDLDETTPAQLLALARELPGQRVLLLNPGYRRLRAIAELMAALPNLWLEIGTVNTQRGVEWLARRFGAERLVFGTGAPVMDDCGPRFLLDHLDLPEADIALIASGGGLL